MTSEKRAVAAKAPKSSADLKESDKQKIVSEVSQLNLADRPDWWAPLDALSNHTKFDDLEVFEDEILLDPGKGKNFHGNANVYVKLVYGGSQDETSITDAFPLQFKGHFEGLKVVIDDVVVDTSSFDGQAVATNDRDR